MKLLKIGVLITSLAFIFSCEDDPIVEPAKDDDNCTGSYCRLSFPDSVHVASNSVKNPTLF